MTFEELKLIYDLVDTELELRKLAWISTRKEYETMTEEEKGYKLKGIEVSQRRKDFLKITDLREKLDNIEWKL